MSSEYFTTKFLFFPQENDVLFLVFGARLCLLQQYLNNGTMTISGLVQCVDMQPAACWPLFNAPCGHDNNGYLFSHFNVQMSFICEVCFLCVNCVANAVE